MLKKIIGFLIIFITSINIFFIGGLNYQSAYVAFAENSINANSDFDKTDPLEDLQLTTDFNILNYPFDNTRKGSIIKFFEYCYDIDTANHAMYVYFYNPKGLNISEESSLNKIQMAVAWEMVGNKLIPSDYDKFDLKYCSKSKASEYNGLFYKFRVLDKIGKDNKTIKQRLNSNERRYDISGAELLEVGKNNAEEYGVSTSYLYKGYAKGFGPDKLAESNLECKTEKLETISLDVHHTFYRTKTSDKGAGYQNQIDSVYFKVPKRFFDTYGKLQRIKAEWYEYKTNDMIVTSNQEFYNNAISRLGSQVTPDNFNYGLYDNYKPGSGSPAIPGSDWAYNDNFPVFVCPERINSIYYLFKTSDITAYDPYMNFTSNGGVSSNELYDYIKSYNKSYVNGRLPIKNNTISADLFASDIDEKRKQNNENGIIKKGYSFYDFDADIDVLSWQSWDDSKPNFWENSSNFGFWNALFGKIPHEEGRAKVAPIEIIDSNKLVGNAEVKSEELLINFNHFDNFRSYVNNAGTDKVVLFRFATSDYYSHAIEIFDYEPLIDTHIKGQAYRAKQSVFFDFDIIQLTFRLDGVDTVIPVVATPIDIVNPITPPTIVPPDSEEFSLWIKRIISIILGLILLIVLLQTGILQSIFKVVIKIITFPFKMLAKLFNDRQKK